MKKQRNIYRKTAFDFLRGLILPLLFTGVIIAMIVSGLMQTRQASGSEGKRILEDGIRRAVVMNYAIEGRYPASIEYIQENYGIHIDAGKYVVHYSIIASNIMPEIKVIEV